MQVDDVGGGGGVVVVVMVMVVVIVGREMVYRRLPPYAGKACRWWCRGSVECRPYLGWRCRRCWWLYVVVVVIGDCGAVHRHLHPMPVGDVVVVDAEYCCCCCCCSSLWC